MNRPIPKAADRKPVLVSNRVEYVEFLKTLVFHDADGRLVIPDYETMIPDVVDYPMLVIWVGELEHEPPIVRPIGLN